MDETQTMHNMLAPSFGESRISKDLELNSSMTIAPTAPDQLENKLAGGSF